MKTKLLLLIPLLLLGGCSKNDADNIEDLTIVTPTGAPAVALAKCLSYKNFSTFSNVSTVKAQMINEIADVAVLPTNTGVDLLKTISCYKLAATITFGNLFVASTGLDEDGVMDENDYIVSFVPNAVPDKIFKSVYQVDGGLHYVEDASEAAKCLKLKKDLSNNSADVDYVLLAEPALTKLANDGVEFNIYANLQTEYQNKYNNQKIFQASIFVHDRLDKTTTNAFLDEVKTNIQLLIENPSQLSEIVSANPNAASTLEINVPAAIGAIQNNNRLGIGFEYAYLNKQQIDTFLNIFGIEPTNEEIYFK